MSPRNSESASCLMLKRATSSFHVQPIRRIRPGKLRAYLGGRSGEFQVDQHRNKWLKTSDFARRVSGNAFGKRSLRELNSPPRETAYATRGPRLLSCSATAAAAAAPHGLGRARAFAVVNAKWQFQEGEREGGRKYEFVETQSNPHSRLKKLLSRTSPSSSAKKQGGIPLPKPRA